MNNAATIAPAVKERPILFSAPMVRAILDERKSQTRRIVKPQPEMVADRSIKPWEGDPAVLLRQMERNGRRCPYGQPGDRLWVKEKWAAPSLLDDSPPVDFDSWAFDNLGWRLWFAADDSMTEEKPPVLESVRGRWRSSLHMPREYSRILLEVTAVRVERLQDISRDDALAEGIDDLSDAEAIKFGIQGVVAAQNPVRAYWLLWESINGPGSWEANPWVWCITFRRVTP